MSQFIEMFKCSAEGVALSSLCDTFIDGDWIEAKDQSDSGIRLIQTGNVGVGTFKDKGDKARYISEDTFNRLNCTEVVEGDILISRLPDPVGRACIIPAGLGKSITAVDCTIIRLNDKVLPKFFVAFTSTPDYAMQIKKVLSGTTRLRVSRANLGKIQVPLPSVDKQQQFVTIAEQADKSGFDGRKSQFIEMFGDPMVNDKQWSEYSCISEITQIVLGSTPNSKEPSYWDGDIRWITPAEMTDQSYYIFDTVRRITDEGRKAANLTVLPEGTVLFSTRAPIGKVAIVGKEMCCNQGFKNFICSEKLNNVFLYYTLKLKKDYLCSLGTGTTFKELSKRTVESLKIAVPPIELQNQFETIYKQADKSGSVLQHMIAC